MHSASPLSDIDGAALTKEDEAPEIVGPTTIEDERLLQGLYRDLHRGEQAKAVLAEAQMRRVIELNQSLEHRPIDGLGAVVVARVPLDMFLAWHLREGHEFWHDPSNLDYFERRANGVGNPGFKIKTKMRPTIVVERKLSGPRQPAGVMSGKSSAGAASTAPATAPRRRGRWRLA